MSQYTTLILRPFTNRRIDINIKEKRHKMKKVIITALLSMASTITVAENVIRVIAPINKSTFSGEWVYSEPVLGAWELSSSGPCSQ
jgi:hypothetical protein